ncbi:hypothetical protein VE03_09863 [Pseudogymnoascus sp. 23342-1-I1]|nr:hypothetical protein VE03_09863 [Pseudogymnoascus sp. 23342-1-I1]
MIVNNNASDSTTKLIMADNMLVGKGIEDKKERKRLQNRIAQRTYRQNQKQRVLALEAAIGASDMNLRLISPPPSTTSSEAVVDMALISPLATTTTTNMSTNDIPHSTSSPTPGPQDHQDANAFDDPSLWSGLSPNITHWHHETTRLPPPPGPSAFPQNLSSPTATAATTGRAALHLAASKGNESMTRLLLNICADVARQDSSGCTPLHLAAEAGHDRIVEILLNKSADPNAVDLMGQTVLFHAVKAGHESTTRLLLKETSLNVNAKDDMGQVALHLAVETGSEPLTLLLLSHGANIDA